MKRITEILDLAGPDTLTLLDELGAGTDPAEGAALAVSILEKLRRHHTLLMATTHYAELKIYALETPGVVNASCEFDVESLMPTTNSAWGAGQVQCFPDQRQAGDPGRCDRRGSGAHVQRRQAAGQRSGPAGRPQAAAEGCRSGGRAGALPGRTRLGGTPRNSATS